MHAGYFAVAVGWYAATRGAKKTTIQAARAATTLILHPSYPVR